MRSEDDKNKMISLFNEYYYLMLHIAMEILKNRALAEDAVSTSIEKIIKNISNIEDVSCYKTKAYIAIIVKNTAIDILRKTTRDHSPVGDLENLPDIIDTDPFMPENFINMEGYKSLVEVIKTLPDTLKDVTILSLVHEYSHKEIAEMLDLSYDVVKMRLSRAKKTIKNILGGEPKDGQ